MTTDAILTTEQILEAFTRTDQGLPRAALEQAIARPEEVNPHLLAAWEAAAEHTPTSDEAINTLFYGAYLLARSRDTRLYRPLCSAARHPDLFEAVLGDGVTEDLWLMLVRCFDGDPAPLRGMIENPNIDEFVRSAGLHALSYLTASGRTSREETASYLRGLYDTLQPRETSHVWWSWQYAVARLGLADLVPLVKDAFTRGWVDESVQNYSHFERDLSKARKAAHLLDAYESYEKNEDKLDDLVEYLSGWEAFQPSGNTKRPIASLPEYMAALAGETAPPSPWEYQEPYQNPLRDVGRNDPCPCGSGKKFKKCCLGKT